jgi:hypothetical protein
MRGVSALLRSAIVSIRAGAAKPPWRRSRSIVARSCSRAACVQEARPGGREERGERVRHPRRRSVLLNPVPGVEHERAARPQDAKRLGERLRLVGEEHDAELADDNIERRVIERQCHRVGLAPLDRSSRADRDRHVEHGLVEIGGDERRRFRQDRPHGPGDDAGAGGDLEHALGRALCDAPRQIVRVGREDQRDEDLVVELRDRAREDLVEGGRSRRARAARRDQVLAAD